MKTDLQTENIKPILQASETLLLRGNVSVYQAAFLWEYEQKLTDVLN